MTIAIFWLTLTRNSVHGFIHSCTVHKTDHKKVKKNARALNCLLPDPQEVHGTTLPYIKTFFRFWEKN